VTESANVEGLNPSVRKDLQVRILPPLPTLSPGSSSRHRRVVAGRNYPAYSILALFVEASDLAGIHCGRASRVTICIARRPDVARPGPFLMAREVTRRPYSARPYVGSGLPIQKLAIAASS
jgi:hypothetical protein